MGFVRLNTIKNSGFEHTITAIYENDRFVKNEVVVSGLFRNKMLSVVLHVYQNRGSLGNFEWCHFNCVRDNYGVESDRPSSVQNNLKKKIHKSINRILQ